MDAIRIARAFTGRDTILKIFGSYHGHHDAVMVSIGVDVDRNGDRDDIAVATRTAGHPAGSRRPDRRGSVQRRRARSSGGSSASTPRAQARVPDHGGGDDEPRRRAARAGLPRGRARASPKRHGIVLIFDEVKTGLTDRRRRRDRALRRRAGHGHAREDARRRASVGRDRRHRGGDGRRRGRHASTRSARSTATR